MILSFLPPQVWCRKCLHSSTGVSPPFQSRDPCLRSESICIEVTTVDKNKNHQNGGILTTEDEENARWTEHFKKVLIRPAPDEEAIITKAIRDLDIDINLPNRQEIITAIKLRNNGKIISMQSFSKLIQNLQLKFFNRCLHQYGNGKLYLTIGQRA